MISSIIMKQVILRNVPDELHRQAKAAAALTGESLQGFILELIKKEIAKGKPKK